MSNEWINIKDGPPQELRADCANPTCYAPNIMCKNCNSGIIVFIDEGQQFIKQANYIKGEFYSMTGHVIPNVTHWMKVSFPIKNSNTYIEDKENCNEN